MEMEDRSRKRKVKTDSGRKEEEEERVVTYFPKSFTFLLVLVSIC